MKEASDVICLCVDNGLFLPLAQKLVEHFKQVYYWSPNERCMPKLADSIIGDGFENVERVPDIWAVHMKVDCWFFPDIGFGGLQKHLIEDGHAVFGHRGGDVIETNRGLFLKTLKQLDMPCPPYEVARGITELRAKLKDVTDKYVKCSKWRGDFETLHWRSWREDEANLDEHAYKLGPAKELLTFYILDPIPTDIEDGVDSYCIGGQFPKTVLHGLERKDKSYLCSVQPMTEIDERVRQANEKFSPILADYDYRGFFSSEVRVNGEDGYFIDPTCRAASPSSQVMTELFGNLGEIIWAGANGELVEPEPTAQFGVQAKLTVDRNGDDWIVMDIPKEIRQWVKCGFACEIDGRICQPPHVLDTMAGWLVATGDTIEEAITNLKEYAKELPSDVDCNVDSLATLLQEAETAKEQGIEFTEQAIPDPGFVVDIA